MRIRRLLVQAILTVLLLELVLQLGAVVVWLTNAGAEVATKDSARRVLCVGDSFTFGIGAETPAGSYPAQLERELRERTGMDFTVANCGYPGQHSADVLLRLDADFDRVRPEHVFVLVGTNDVWRKPARVELPARSGASGSDPTGFRWRFRVGHLATWLFDRLGDARGAAVGVGGESLSPDLFVGRAFRTVRSERLEFHGDGVLFAAPFVGSWRVEGRSVWFGFGGELQEYSVTEHEHGLLLEAVGTHPSQLLASDPEPFVSGELPDEQFVESTTLRIDAAARLGRTKHARRLLEELLERVGPQPSAEEATSVALSYHRLGADREHLEWCRVQAPRFPDDFALHVQYATACWALDLTDEGMRVAEVAERTAKEPDERARAYRAKARIRKFAGDPPSEVLSDLIRGLLANDDADMFLEEVGLLVSPLPTAAQLDHVFKNDSALGHGRARVESLLSSVVTRAANVEDVLVDHLVQFVDRCRERGAGVTLVGYPSGLAETERAMTRVRDARGVAVVRVQRAFRELLTERPREEIFAPDGGHCTAEGYALLARLVAESFVSRLD